MISTRSQMMRAAVLTRRDGTERPRRSVIVTLGPSWDGHEQLLRHLRSAPHTPRRITCPPPRDARPADLDTPQDHKQPLRSGTVWHSLAKARRLPVPIIRHDHHMSDHLPPVLNNASSGDTCMSRDSSALLSIRVICVSVHPCQSQPPSSPRLPM